MVMKRVVAAVLLSATLALGTVSTAQAGGGCGYDGNVFVARGSEAGLYHVLVHTDGPCWTIEDSEYRAIARRFIKTGSVAGVANPDFWTVEIIDQLR